MNYFVGSKEYTKIPVGIKIFKLIVNELSSELEKDEIVDENEDEDDEVFQHLFWF